jgi:hypothetical protein
MLPGHQRVTVSTLFVANIVMRTMEMLMRKPPEWTLSIRSILTAATMAALLADDAVTCRLASTWLTLEFSPT